MPMEPFQLRSFLADPQHLLNLKTGISMVKRLINPDLRMVFCIHAAVIILLSFGRSYGLLLPFLVALLITRIVES